MKEKKLSERISERVINQRGSERKQKYLPIFLSLKSDIGEAYRAGWKIKSIWETLHFEKKFDGTYECFLSYFNKYLKREGGSNLPSVDAPPSPEETRVTAAPPATAPTASQDFNKKFTHDPVPKDLKSFA